MNKHVATCKKLAAVALIGFVAMTALAALTTDEPASSPRMSPSALAFLRGVGSCAGSAARRAPESGRLARDVQ